MTGLCTPLNLSGQVLGGSEGAIYSPVNVVSLHRQLDYRDVSDISEMSILYSETDNDFYQTEHKSGGRGIFLQPKCLNKNDCSNVLWVSSPEKIPKPEYDSTHLLFFFSLARSTLGSVEYLSTLGIALIYPLSKAIHNYYQSPRHSPHSRRFPLIEIPCQNSTHHACLLSSDPSGRPVIFFTPRQTLLQNEIYAAVNYQLLGDPMILVTQNQEPEPKRPDFFLQHEDDGDEYIAYLALKYENTGVTNIVKTVHPLKGIIYIIFLSDGSMIIIDLQTVHQECYEAQTYPYADQSLKIFRPDNIQSNKAMTSEQEAGKAVDSKTEPTPLSDQTSTTTAENKQITDLPPEVLHKIVALLPISDIKQLAHSCKKLYYACHGNQLVFLKYLEDQSAAWVKAYIKRLLEASETELLNEQLLKEYLATKNSWLSCLQHKPALLPEILEPKDLVGATKKDNYKIALITDMAKTGILQPSYKEIYHMDIRDTTSTPVYISPEKIATFTSSKLTIWSPNDSPIELSLKYKIHDMISLTGEKLVYLDVHRHIHKIDLKTKICTQLIDKFSATNFHLLTTLGSCLFSTSDQFITISSLGHNGIYNVSIWDYNFGASSDVLILKRKKQRTPPWGFFTTIQYTPEIILFIDDTTIYSYNTIERKIIERQDFFSTFKTELKKYPPEIYSEKFDKLGEYILIKKAFLFTTDHIAFVAGSHLATYSEKFVYSTFTTNSIIIWNLLTQKIHTSFKIESKYYLDCSPVAVLQNGLITVLTDNHLNIWDPGEKTILHQYQFNKTYKDLLFILGTQVALVDENHLLIVNTDNGKTIRAQGFNHEKCMKITVNGDLILINYKYLDIIRPILIPSQLFPKR